MKPASSSDKQARCIDSEKLFAGQRCLKIKHESEEYRLSITAAGKLILTK